MASSDLLFNRQRTLHDILGGGLVADLILWRRKNLTVGILLVTLAAWVMFERSAVLNRPAPPLPKLHLSEETVNEVAAFIRTRVNDLLSASQDVALGKDSRLFLKIAAYLCLISIVGGLTDFLTLAYTSLFIVLTVPALYERYEDCIDRNILKGYHRLCQLYVKINVEYVSRVQNWIVEKEKLC
ncbi:PREDICTED: reticulon-like protein B12 isoform X2 [Lupinus angustifolius]|uniref:reticulon-like protein B12 isoform X2 n=1 Tax=Lupinus angustifolius TaxID=3871 RepID=UPI00092F9E74|nr:PREDICTED: reticulon-like protein B12 isoform X2 [Lupinus angustifolius]